MKLISTVQCAFCPTQGFCLCQLFKLRRRQPSLINGERQTVQVEATARLLKTMAHVAGALPSVLASNYSHCLQGQESAKSHWKD